MSSQVTQDDCHGGEMPAVRPEGRGNGRPEESGENLDGPGMIPPEEFGHSPHSKVLRPLDRRTEADFRGNWGSPC